MSALNQSLIGALQPSPLLTAPPSLLELGGDDRFHSAVAGAFERVREMAHQKPLLPTPLPFGGEKLPLLLLGTEFHCEVAKAILAASSGHTPTWRAYGLGEEEKGDEGREARIYYALPGEGEDWHPWPSLEVSIGKLLANKILGESHTPRRLRKMLNRGTFFPHNVEVGAGGLESQLLYTSLFRAYFPNAQPVYTESRGVYSESLFLPALNRKVTCLVESHRILLLPTVVTRMLLERIGQPQYQMHDKGERDATVKGKREHTCSLHRDLLQRGGNGAMIRDPESHRQLVVLTSKLIDQGEYRMAETLLGALQLPSELFPLFKKPLVNKLHTILLDPRTPSDQEVLIPLLTLFHVLLDALEEDYTQHRWYEQVMDRIFLLKESHFFPILSWMVRLGDVELMEMAIERVEAVHDRYLDRVANRPPKSKRKGGGRKRKKREKGMSREALAKAASLLLQGWENAGICHRRMWSFWADRCDAGVKCGLIPSGRKQEHYNAAIAVLHMIDGIESRDELPWIEEAEEEDSDAEELEGKSVLLRLTHSVLYSDYHREAEVDMYGDALYSAVQYLGETDSFVGGSDHQGSLEDERLMKGVFLKCFTGGVPKGWIPDFYHELARSLYDKKKFTSMVIQALKAYKPDPRLLWTIVERIQEGFSLNESFTSLAQDEQVRGLIHSLWSDRALAKLVVADDLEPTLFGLRRVLIRRLDSASTAYSNRRLEQPVDVDHEEENEQYEQVKDLACEWVESEREVTRDLLPAFLELVEDFDPLDGKRRFTKELMEPLVARAQSMCDGKDLFSLYGTMFIEAAASTLCGIRTKSRALKESKELNLVEMTSLHSILHRLFSDPDFCAHNIDYCTNLLNDVIDRICTGRNDDLIAQTLFRILREASIFLQDDRLTLSSKQMVRHALHRMGLLYARRAGDTLCPNHLGYALACLESGGGRGWREKLPLHNTPKEGNWREVFETTCHAANVICEACGGEESAQWQEIKLKVIVGYHPWFIPMLLQNQLQNQAEEKQHSR